MNLKRLTAGLLVSVTLLGMVPAVAAPQAENAPLIGAASSFQDITDPKIAEAAEMLRLLGVVSGTGGGFNPSGTLTRAEFCKMAVEVMGKGDQEPANRNRTIFLDVGPTHWARGYINLASSIPLSSGSGSDSGADKDSTTKPVSTDRLIMGVGNGNFEPETKMTVGAAVAILTRVLGYSNADVAIGAVWYDGYLAIAKQNGLLDGLTVSGSANITRGQAALLFQNLLFAKSKGSDAIYLTTLKGKVSESTVILSTEATAKDGTTGAVQTPDASYKTKSSGITSELEGVRGKLVLDKDDNVLSFLPDENDTIRRVSVMGSAQANYVPVTGDEKLDVTIATKVWKGTEATTYEKVWTSLHTGTPLVFCYNSADKLDYIFMPTSIGSSQDGTIMVAKNKPNGTINPFTSLTGNEKNYTIYKNGVPATVADIQQYDVAEYDKGSKILYVSDLRLTGYYENAYPNTSAPSTIKMMGADRTVLPSAIADLSKFKVGEQVTVLFTGSGQIAGAVSPSVAKSTAVGVAEVKGGKASITLLDGVLKLEGETTANDTLNGYLVNVTSSKPGFLNLSRITGQGTDASLNVAARTLGNRELSAGVALYEQVGNGPMAQIKLSDITCTNIPAEKITYVSYDGAGKVNRMVLNDVTGDRYFYGIVKYTPSGFVEDESSGRILDDTDEKKSSTFHNGTISVTSGRTDNPSLIVGSADARTGEMGGIAPSLDKIEQSYKLAAYVSLKSISGVARSAFNLDEKIVSTTKATLPISEDVQYFNKTANEWKTGIEGLEIALAFSDNLTVYYDKAPENGGKVRIVVVE